MTFSNRLMGLGRVALFLSAGVALTAQESGALSGVIKSSEGKPLSGVSVTVKAPQLITPRTVKTGADGVYRVPLLPSGDYTISAIATGYIGASATGVRVGLGGKMTQDFTLKSTKAVEAVVEVVSTGATVDKTDTKTSSNFSGEQLNALPAADRSFFGAADVAPGVITTNTGSITVRGGTTQSTVYTLNGVSIGDDYQGQQYNQRVVDDAIEDVQVVQSPLNARFGRTSGGLINVQSKSGGNDFEGTIRTRLTKDDWAAWRPYERATGSARADQESVKRYEITFAGPIIKDKLWFAAATVQQPSVASSSSLLAGEDLSTWGVGYNFNPGDLQSLFTGLPENYYGWDKGKTISSGLDRDQIDVKLTYALNQDHTLEYQFYRRKDKSSNVNPYGIPIIATVGSNSLAQVDLYKTNAFGYKGVLASNVFIEAHYSRLISETSFPAPSLDHVRMYGSGMVQGVVFPYGFNIAPQTDARNNQSGDLNLKIFADWNGTHEIDMGVQYYEFIRGTASKNGPNNSRFYVNYATADAAELAFAGPVVDPTNAAPFTTWDPYVSGLDPYGNNVGFLVANRADDLAFFGGSPGQQGISPSYRKYYGDDGTTKNRTASMYVNDQWSLNSHIGLMGGLRMDRLKVYDTDGKVIMHYNTPISPRFQFRYDLSGDSTRLITFTAARFYEDFRGGFTDAFVKKANATYATYGWSGSAPGHLGLVNYAAITNPANYGGPNSGGPLAGGTGPYQVFSSAYNNFGMNDITSPYTDEFSLGYRRNYKDGSFVSVNAVHREWKNQLAIQQEFNSSYVVTVPDVTGLGLPSQKGFATRYGNSDLLTRRYNALELEFANKINHIWAFAGSLTVSRLTGNTNGGDSGSQGFRDNSVTGALFLRNWLQNQGPVTAFSQAYTEAQFAPDGPLISDQAFKGRLSLTAKLPIGKGFMSYAWMFRYDSGTNYSAVANNSTNSGLFSATITSPRPSLPGTVPIYYSGRGAFRVNDTYQVDFKLGYEIPLGVGKTRLMGDFQVNNFFNHQQQASFSHGFTSSTLAIGTPITVANRLTYGQDQQDYSNFIAPRSLSASIGLRF